jgi:hypothetical protein
MFAGPMQDAADTAVSTCNRARAANEFEAVSFIEIDCVNAFKALMARGSPRLRSALVAAALSETVAA